MGTENAAQICVFEQKELWTLYARRSAVLADSGEKLVFKFRSIIGQHPSLTCICGKKSNPMPERHGYSTTS